MDGLGTKMKKSVVSENLDRLSELPNSLILHILSLLPMRDVVSTTLISKRWKNLWTTIPCLNFIGEVGINGTERIRNFVNRALILWRGAKILKFKIDFDQFFMSLAEDIDFWVRFAVENKVEELNVHLLYHRAELGWDDDAISSSQEYAYSAPQCLNSCSSLKELSLVGCNLRIPESPPWNQLKRLRIDGFCYSEDLINRVLCAAPRLEVFSLRLLESFENLNIESGSLRKLTVKKYLFLDENDQPSTDTVLRISCPNLETLEISGVLYSNYVLMNASSLTDATLGFKGSYYYDNHGLSGNELLGEALRQIFSSIRQVEKVALSDWCVQVFGAIEEKYLLSPLSNVEFLKLNVGIIELDKMVYILGMSPKLKRLVVEHKGYRKTVHYEDSEYETEYVREGEQCVTENHLEHENNLPKDFLLLLRTVEITSPLSEASPVFSVIGFVLKHASMLEKMVIRTKGDSSCSSEKLLSMPRSSPTSKERVVSRYHYQ